MMKAGKFRNPRFSRPSCDVIDLELFIDGIGFVPYSAVKGSPDKSNAEVFSRAMRGEFGKVGPFENFDRLIHDKIRSELSRTQSIVSVYMENYISGLSFQGMISHEEFQKLVSYRNDLRAWKPGMKDPVRT